MKTVRNSGKVDLLSFFDPGAILGIIGFHRSAASREVAETGSRA